MITSGQTLTGKVEQAFSQAPAYTGTINSWSATGLPPGLSINSASGLITGLPAAYGDFSVTIPLPLKISSFSAGTNHFLAVTEDGLVKGYGDNDYGQLNVPAGLTGVVAVATGLGHSLALKSNGTVVGWGSNDNGQSLIPSALSGVVAIRAGRFHSLALKSNGTVVGWGAGINNPPSGLSGVAKISVFRDYSIALKTDGTVVGWGDPDWLANNYGSSLLALQYKLNQLSEIAGVVDIAASNTFVLALKSDGTVVSVSDQQQYTGDPTFQSPPTGLTGVSAIAAGQNYALALKSDGTVVAWGDSFAGFPYYSPGIPPLSGVTALTSSGGGPYTGYSVALKNDGTAVYWGLFPGAGFDWGESILYSETVAFEIAPEVPLIAPNQVFSGAVGSYFSATPSLLKTEGRPVHEPIDLNGQIVYLKTWEATGLPAGFQIHEGTGQIFSYTHQDAVQFVVTLKAFGPAGESAPVTATISIAVGPPIIVSGQSFSGKVGESFSATPALSDEVDRPATSWAITSGTLPSGLALNTTTGAITGTPTAKVSRTVSLRASGGGGVGTATSISFSINDGAPLITPGQTFQGRVGLAFSGTPALTDSTNRPVTSWSATGLPAGLSINAATGAITGTPTAEESSTPTITATGPGGTGTQSVSFSIAAAILPPVITPGQSASGTVGQVFSFNPASSGTITSWAASNLPAGLSINTSSGQITGTPTTDGSYSTSITATNLGGSDTKTLAFTISAAIPIFAGAIRATAVYAGAVAAKALYYGPSLLWNAAGWEPSTLQNNLLAFYRLNDAGGGALSLADSSGNNRTLTNTNATALSSGLAQGAASFTGSSQFLTGSIPFNPAQPYSISMWVNVSTLKNYFSIISGSTVGTLNIHGDSSGGLSWNNGAAGDFSQSGFFAANQWMHCVFVRGSANAMTVYKNGTLVKTATGSTSYSAISLLDIGNVRHMSGFQFAGKIDAVGVWNRALTTAEIGKLYNSGTGFEF